MKTTRHRSIYQELLTEILSGKYDSAKRLPSEAELVLRFGVSRPTVARALLDLKNEGILERRAGAGSFLRSDRDAKTSTQQLGLLVPGLGRIEIFEVICGELASLARVHDFGMHWGVNPGARSETDMSINEAEELCQRFIEKKVRGVFFAPFEHTADNEAANRRITERLSHSGICVVLLDRDICPFPQRSGFDLVGIDNYAGGFQLAEHLIKLGARKLAFVTRPFSATTVEARKSGAISAMMAHGIFVPKGFLHQGECTDLKFVQSLIFDKSIDGVICTNDHTAAQLLQSLTKMNIRTPHDLRVVGFDDVRYATLLSVPLTTIQQPCRDIAITAFNAMRERLVDPVLPARSLLLTPRLVIRESCGAYLR